MDNGDWVMEGTAVSTWRPMDDASASRVRGILQREAGTYVMLGAGMTMLRWTRVE